MTSIAAAAAAAALDTLAQLMPGAHRLLLLVIPLTVLVLIGAAQLLQEEDRSRAESATVVVIGAPGAAADLDLTGLVESLSPADLHHLVARLNAAMSAAEPEIRDIAAGGEQEFAVPVPFPRRHARVTRSGRPALRLCTGEGNHAQRSVLVSG